MDTGYNFSRGKKKKEPQTWSSIINYSKPGDENLSEASRGHRAILCI